MGKYDEEIRRLEAMHKPRGHYDHCYSEGKAARLQGYGHKACPYGQFTLEESHWMRGWAQAKRIMRKGRGNGKPTPETDDDGGITIL